MVLSFGFMWICSVSCGAKTVWFLCHFRTHFFGFMWCENSMVLKFVISRKIFMGLLAKFVISNVLSGGFIVFLGCFTLLPDGVVLSHPRGLM